MSKQYSYSTDEEHYHGHFETPELAAEECFSENEQLSQCWVAENVHFETQNFINADYILEQIVQSAEDECGEAASDWLQWPNELQNELEVLIAAFIDKHDPIRFYGITNIKIITKEHP